MIRKLFKTSLLAIATTLCIISAPASAAGGVKVLMQTNMGDITLRLDDEKAPISVKNFLRYVDEGYYDGTIFHRVIKDFMIQGGGFNEKYRKKDTHEMITNEADNGLRNVRGSIAMARTNAPHSASSQFFINTVDNDFLDHKGKNRRGWGYAVFGRVISGMNVVDDIQQMSTGRGGPFQKDVPRKMVIIKRVSRI